MTPDSANSGQSAPPGREGEGRLWSAWGSGRLLLWALFCILGNALLQGALFALTGQVFLALALGGLVAVLLPSHLLARAAGGNLATEFHLGPARPAVLALAAVAAAASLLPTSWLAELSQRIHPIPEEWLAFEREHLPTTTLGIAVAVIAAVLVVPLAEELIFRGVLHRLASRIWGGLPAGLLSAGVFALLHGEPWFLFGLFGLGLLLAYVFETTRSVTACAVAHAVHNGVALAVLLGSQDLLTETTGAQTATTLDVPWWQIAASAACLVAACLGLARTGRRR